VRGRRFVHPELGFAFEAPQGFRLRNTPQAVLGQDEAGRLMIFAGADLSGRSPEDYVAAPGLQQLARMLGVEVSRPRNVESFEVDGLPGASASAAIRQDGRQADAGLAAIDAGETDYQFIFVSPGQMSGAEARAYQATVDSFERLSAQQAAAFAPQRIAVVPVEAGASAEALARRMAVDEAPLRRFEILNALALRDGLAAGEQVKLIVE
jgi:predicted Zn-dependent protease